MNPETRRRAPLELYRSIWTTLEIFRQATAEEIAAVTPGASYRAVRAALRRLEVHGYVTKQDNRKAVYRKAVKSLYLHGDCERCGASLTAATCDFTNQ
jgi:transcription initiation factor IIE alpha subunit